MVGMLQIITYLLAFYLIVKGFEVLQIGLASARTKRGGVIVFGIIVLLACIVVAVGIVFIQETHVLTIGNKSYKM